MKRLAWLLAACCLAAPTWAQEAPARTPDEAEQEAYARAVELMAENRYDEARAALEKLLKQAPQYAGAWLELAITHCELGNKTEAEQLFREIEKRFKPSTGIMDVINARRQNGCLGWEPKSTRNLTFTRAVDTNVNQGASNPIFVTGGIEVHLADDFLPQRDSYSQVAFDMTRELTQQGTSGMVQMRALRHDHLREQDTAALVLGLDRPFELGSWSFRTVGNMGMVTLGGKMYQRQVQLQGWVAPPITLPDHLYILGTAAIGRIDYTSRSSFNANTAEAGLVTSYRGSSTQGQAGMGLLVDHGSAARLGGNRHGSYANAQLQYRFDPSWQGELGWSRQHWNGQTPYSPGSIDVVRNQDTQQWRLGLTLNAAPHHSLLLELRHVRNKENISLYQYNGHALQLSWRWNGF